MRWGISRTRTHLESSWTQIWSKPPTLVRRASMPESSDVKSTMPGTSGTRVPGTETFSREAPEQLIPIFRYVVFPRHHPAQWSRLAVFFDLIPRGCPTRSGPEPTVPEEPLPVHARSTTSTCAALLCVRWPDCMASPTGFDSTPLSGMEHVRSGIQFRLPSPEQSLRVS